MTLTGPTTPTHLEACMTVLVVATEASLLESGWAFLQDVATFAVALIAIWAAVVRPSMARHEAKRRKELAARDEARRAEIVAEVEKVVEPIREQVSQIHRTTHVNGGKSNPPTFRDEVNEVGKRVETAIRAVGAVAVNQAHLSERFDRHEREGEKYLEATREALSTQGIQLPEVPTSLPPRFDDDPV